MKCLFKITAAMALMAVSVGVHADDGRMVLATPTGSTSIAISSISKITFDGTQMTINATDGMQQVDGDTLDSRESLDNRDNLDFSKKNQRFFLENVFFFAIFVCQLNGKSYGSQHSIFAGLFLA